MSKIDFTKPYYHIELKYGSQKLFIVQSYKERKGEEGYIIVIEEEFTSRDNGKSYKQYFDIPIDNIAFIMQIIPQEK